MYKLDPSPDSHCWIVLYVEMFYENKMEKGTFFFQQKLQQTFEKGVEQLWASQVYFLLSFDLFVYY